MKQLHILLVDPIAYAGGSKVATARMLALLDPNRTRVTIVTRDPDSWAATEARTSPLFEFDALTGKDRGLGYFLRHFMIVFSLLWARIRYGRFERALGASGPGIDLSLYLARRIFGYQIVQLVHGPVARSRTIGRALESADRVYYLESAADSLLAALATLRPAVDVELKLDASKFACFSNGLVAEQWPTPNRSSASGIFWAASLLKWKGLGTLIKSLQLLTPSLRPHTHICYIRPKDTCLELGPGPVEIERVHWYENPLDLDQIRAGCSIFISTSKNEPFGLSILESMAAGLVILIPRDNAYWDQKLQDQEHCLKYRTDDAEDLALKILYLLQNPELVEHLARQSRLMARQYRAEQVYGEIVASLSEPNLSASLPTANSGRTLDHAEV
jgi:glycosyltransferase involved in cell wall biosynthesis